MRQWLERVWYRRAPPPLALRPLAGLYRRLAAQDAARKRARAVKLPVPVIVVGNISVGGTGKTPCVLWLADLLQARGLRPGIISRGYGGRGPFPQRVTPDSDPAACGDEPALLALRARVPLVVAPDRVAAGRCLLQHHPEVDVILCDDGLQHYALSRDLEICVVDGQRGLGNGWQLPAGPLREPPERLEACDLVLVNGGDPDSFGPRALRFDLRIDVALNLVSGEERPLAAFRDRVVDAVAGIGNPQRFFSALAVQGLDLRAHPFPDHHAYRPEDLPGELAAPVLMTEKDAVKCRGFARPHWWAVPARLELSSQGLQQVLQRLAAAGVLSD